MNIYSCVSFHCSGFTAYRLTIEPTSVTTLDQSTCKSSVLSYPVTLVVQSRITTVRELSLTGTLEVAVDSIEQRSNGTLEHQDRRIVPICGIVTVRVELLAIPVRNQHTLFTTHHRRTTAINPLNTVRRIQVEHVPLRTGVNIGRPRVRHTVMIPIAPPRVREHPNRSTAKSNLRQGAIIETRIRNRQTTISSLQRVTVWMRSRALPRCSTAHTNRNVGTVVANGQLVRTIAGLPINVRIR